MEHKESEHLARIEDRLRAGDDRMNVMQAELTRNTEITNEVRELLDAAKAGLKVLGWIGKSVRVIGALAAAVVAIWSVVYAITHHGQLPPGKG